MKRTALFQELKMTVGLSFAKHTSRKKLYVPYVLLTYKLCTTQKDTHSELLQGALTLTITVPHVSDHTVWSSYTGSIWWLLDVLS